MAANSTPCCVLTPLIFLAARDLLAPSASTP